MLLLTHGTLRTELMLVTSLPRNGLFVLILLKIESLTNLNVFWESTIELKLLIVWAPDLLFSS